MGVNLHALYPIQGARFTSLAPEVLLLVLGRYMRMAQWPYVGNPGLSIEAMLVEWLQM